jgi:2-phosphoglycerate kinase
VIDLTESDIEAESYGDKAIEKERKAEKDLNHMDAIWELQSYLLNEADRVGIPIISSQGIEETIGEVLGIISDAITKMFPVGNGKKKSKKTD